MSSSSMNSDSVSTSDFFVGSSIMLLSAVLYAIGLSIQRAAATSHTAEEAVYGCRSPAAARYARLWWVVGLLIYGFGGLGLGTLAFSYLPLALCSSLFTSTLVFNAILARLWLKESVTRTDAVLYCCIVGGVSLTAACLPRETEILKIHESSLLYGDASAVACWVVMGLALAFLHYLILVRFERQYDDPVHHYAKQPKRIYRIAMFSYPFILGSLEGISYLCLKTFNNWYYHWSDGDETQTQHFFFWTGVSIAPVLLVWTLFWLRKGYARFPITQIFPVELASLTIVSVMGGLFVHDEADMMSWQDSVWVALGLVILVTAIMAVAFFKSADHEHADDITTAAAPAVAARGAVASCQEAACASAAFADGPAAAPDAVADPVTPLSMPLPFSPSANGDMVFATAVPGEVSVDPAAPGDTIVADPAALGDVITAAPPTSDEVSVADLPGPGTVTLATQQYMAGDLPAMANDRPA